MNTSTVGFPGSIVKKYGRNGLNFDVRMFSDHLQNKLDFGGKVNAILVKGERVYNCFVSNSVHFCLV